jgi:putative endonuclease
MRYTVYIIRSSKTNQYYIGMTSNLEKRIKSHNKNSGRFTKGKGPWELIYKEEFEDKKSAWLRERQLKRYKGWEAFKKLTQQFHGRVA